MTLRDRHAATLVIAMVWCLFGVLGKLYPITAIHQEIVARVFGESLSPAITCAIGIGELLMAVWVVSNRWPVLCGWTQITLVAAMNCIELVVARDLLLWGPLNAVFALLFVGLVYLTLVAPRGAQARPRAPG